MKRLARRLAPMFVLAALSGPAVAQEEAPASADAGGSSGSPVVGYVIAGFLIAAGMFVLCKSARR